MNTIYQKRREQLLQNMQSNSIAIIPSADLIYRNGDSSYHFRQDSDFYYMTGFNEPESVAVLVKEAQSVKYILFVRPKDAQSELWDGKRAGLDGAKTVFGANESYDIADLNNKMPELIGSAKQIYCHLGKNKSFDEGLDKWLNQVRKKVRAGVNSPSAFIALEKIIHEMRLIKSADEIAIMRKANEISKAAHLRAMQICKPGMMEYEIEAELSYVFQKNGARHAAYTSIVGGGENACVLHYIDNNQTLKNGDLILIDAGCEYENYSSDITRTFPVNGKFSAEQKALYQIVLDAQLAALDLAKPGTVWTQLQDAIIRTITQGLVSLGILNGKVDELIAQKAFLPFYMHNSGHWLGLDTHDAGNYKLENQWRTLQPGMVITVEPGIYVGKNPNVDKKWHDIGIRIEDDIVITQDGHENLTQGLPKTIADLEKMIGTV